MNTMRYETVAFAKRDSGPTTHAPYLFELLQTGRRHVRVSSELGASGWRQSGAEATDLASALAAESRVAVPPLKSFKHRNLEQGIGRFLRHDRLVPGRELPPAHAAPPRRLEIMDPRFDYRRIKRRLLDRRGFRLLELCVEQFYELKGKSGKLFVFEARYFYRLEDG